MDKSEYYTTRARIYLGLLWISTSLLVCLLLAKEFPQYKRSWLPAMVMPLLAIVIISLDYLDKQILRKITDKKTDSSQDQTQKQSIPGSAPYPKPDDKTCKSKDTKEREYYKQMAKEYKWYTIILSCIAGLSCLSETLKQYRYGAVIMIGSGVLLISLTTWVMIHTRQGNSGRYT